MVFYKLKLILSSSLAKLWYWLMTPLAYVIYKVEPILYKRRKNQITEDKAVKWIAEDIARAALRYKGGEEIMICKSTRDPYLETYTLHDFRPSYLKRKKSIMAHDKFRDKMTVEMQELIVAKLKTFKGIKVTEGADSELSNYDLERIDNYVKNVIVKRK